MKEFIETQTELENKLSEIHAAAQKAQAEKRSFHDGFFVVNSLFCSLPPLAREEYGYSLPTPSCDSPLFKGFATVVVANIECSADYRLSAERALAFERRGRDVRCFYADGLYLYYPYIYNEKTHCLASLSYGDLCRKYSPRFRGSLAEPKKIGAVTAKKLQAWTEYFKSLVSLCEEAKAEDEARIAEFREKLRTVCPDKADLNEGSATINGIRFTWEIRPEGYIRAVCDLAYEYSYGIDSFIKLINMNK